MAAAAGALPVTVRQRWRLPRERHDELVALLHAHGTLGIVDHDDYDGVVTLDAFFAPVAESPRASRRLAACGAGLLFEQAEEARDWLAGYRRSVQPIPIGRRFLVDPREPDQAAPTARSDEDPARLVLRVPARRAFGTGSHATTQLVLEALEDLPLDGAAVLDVGTGTGVLAFAATRLGARCVVAYDVDRVAACHARENERWNGGTLHLFAGTVHCVRAQPRFDVLLVNVLAERVQPSVPRLARLLRRGGVALVSGVLSARAEEELAPWHAAGLRSFERRRREEWLLACLGAAGDP